MLEWEFHKLERDEVNDNVFVWKWKEDKRVASGFSFNIKTLTT